MAPARDVGVGIEQLRRVGLLIPSSNTVMERDFHTHLGNRASIHTARMFMEDTTSEGESRMLDEFVIPAAETVATVYPDIVVFGCTSAGALRGNAYDEQLCARISETTAATSVSVIRSVREAIDSSGAKRIGVITPYIDELNDKIRESIEAERNVEVADIFGLGLTENFAIAQVTPCTILEFARQTFGHRSIDLLFASCTNFRAVDALPLLNESFDIPVITSNQAVLDAVGQLLKAAPRDA